MNLSPFAKDFEARRDLIHRAGVMDELNAQTAPSTIIAWAARKKIPMPPELVEAVRALESLTAAKPGAAGGLSYVDLEYNERFNAPSPPLEADEDFVSADKGAPVSRGGRPPQYDWDTFTMEIIRRANLPDGLPDTQADLVREMLSWFQETHGQEPAESAIKARVSKIYRYLGKAKNSAE